MKIETRRFGEIEIDDRKILSFPQGIPGLEEVRRFALIHHDRTYPINWLQAVDVPHVSLPVIDPFDILPDYEFDISDSDITDLSLKAKNDLHVVSVVVIPEDIRQMTVNLSAPILINIKLNIGKQVIIDRRDYQIRCPIFEPICKKFKEVRIHAGADPQGK